jgi:hypothetical protein
MYIANMLVKVALVAALVGAKGARVQFLFVFGIYVVRQVRSVSSPKVTLVTCVRFIVQVHRVDVLSQVGTRLERLLAV